jgi:hypothetical protein
MPDDDLRALERTFRDTGSHLDEVAWLLARVRAGLVPRDRLQLAAWLGHRAAEEVIGDDARDFRAAPHSTPAMGPLANVELPTGWIKNAAPLDPELGLRVGIAALNRVLPASGLVSDAGSPVQLAEDWLISRSELHLAAVQATLEQLADYTPDEPSRLPQAVEFLLSMVVDGLDQEPLERSQLGGSPEEALMAALLGDTPPSTFVAGDILTRAMTGGAELGVSVDDVMVAVRNDLAPWLLGTGDPVRMRVAKRGQIGILPEELTE